jgi:hypothetical protein
MGRDSSYTSTLGAECIAQNGREQMGVGKKAVVSVIRRKFGVLARRTGLSNLLRQ